MGEDLNVLSDDELLHRVHAREGDALMALYRRYRLRVFALKGISVLAELFIVKKLCAHRGGVDGCGAASVVAETFSTPL